MARAGRGFPMAHRLHQFNPAAKRFAGELVLQGAGTVSFTGSEYQLLIVSVAPAQGTTSEGFDYPPGIGLYGAGVLLNYSTPAESGNLVQSLASQPGTDGLGNMYPAGMSTFQFTLTPVTTQPATPGAGCILYYKSGSLCALGPSGTAVTIATT